MRTRRVALTFIATAAAGFSLAGCGGTNPLLTENPSTPATVPVQGQVKGGGRPIPNATMQLYAVGTSGYGSAATPLFASGLTTDANGNFTFPSGYCPSDPNALVYLVATGGQPEGAGPNVTNLNEALMVALGPCNNLNSSTHISMNELTTVAAVWALAPFMSGPTNAYLNIGSPASNATGLALAFQAAQQVVNTGNGSIGGTNLPSGATLPDNELNTLADILAYCVDSGGGTGGDGSRCGNLFSDASNGSGYPTDTITAALNIAENPARNASALFSRAQGITYFQPLLSSAPTAWTVAIQYTGGGLNAPTAIAADQNGSIWVTNSGNNTVSEFDNLGNSLRGSGVSIAGTPTGIAIDLSGNAWITVKSANSLYELSSGGSLGSAITNNGLSEPTSVAIDGGGLVWVTNSGGSGGNTISVFTSSGGAVSGSPFSGGGIASPAGIAINGNANANCSDCN